MLWTIWLTRNECVFVNNRIPGDIIIRLFKTRAWEWSLAKNLISAKFQTNWLSAPVQAYNGHLLWEKNRLIDSIVQKTSLVGFVDGSWKATGRGYKMGLGGFLLDHNRKVQFIFSGPVHNSNQVWKVELRALFFLFKAIKETLGLEASCCIATDSNIVSDGICKSRANRRVEDVAAEYYRVINPLSNTKFLLISRNLNGAVEKLAKMGAARSNMVSGWG